MNKYLCSLILFLLVSESLHAGAACCAAKGDLPSLIIDHSQNQFSISVTGSTVIGTSDRNGDSEFYHSEKFDRSLSVSGTATTKLSESFQLGASFPFLIKSSRDLNRRANTKGIGDPSLSLGYELVDHHYGRLPQTFLAFALGIPVGDSPEDSGLLIPDASVGSGHWTLQTGVVSLQSWESWSASFQALAQYSIPKEIESNTQKIEIHPGWTLGAKLRGGKNFFNQKFYLGLGLGPKWQEAQIRKDVFGTSKKGNRLVWDASIDANLVLRDELSVALTYSDQTLIGPTHRSPLSRSLGLSFQARK